MTLEQQIKFLQAQRELCGLLIEWSTTSDAVKRTTVRDVAEALALIPIPDVDETESSHVS